jgi:glutamate-ammonia-ligase adenylyltransferase
MDNKLIKRVKSFNPCLQQAQHISWQQCIELDKDLFQSLSPACLKDFTSAITLSEFVLRSSLQAPHLVLDLFTSGLVYRQQVPDYSELLQQALIDCQNEQQLHHILRRFRLQHMVSIAIGDLVLDVSLDRSLKLLSTLADALICSAQAWLTEHCQHKWGSPQNSQGETIPLLVYAMGKLGGEELNFSSDIDLIFAYPESGVTVGARRSLDNQQFFTRLGQKLITALHQVTVDGFVYRVDMRLRPFGESGPLVMSFNAMEDYYQEQGRDWERYAMLKARLVGNSAYHQQLSSLIRPFVYRRYIDFSVFDSLRRMKMMISQEVRRKQLVDNIKLGAGGIREIEFIVQVFQLIRGGRVKQLQQRNLLTVLPALVTAAEINQASMLTLEKAYRFLRRVENIIQAINDQQSQTLPQNELDRQRILHVMGFVSWPPFMATLSQHMQAVHQEFIVLIGEDGPEHQAQDEQWVTLWHSQWQDNEGIAWLQQIAPEWSHGDVWRQISLFRHESNRRIIGNRGRQVLDKLMPLLLCALYHANFNAVTLERVLLVLNKIVTRTAYLELLLENVGALKHLFKLCHASLWLTEYIAKYPILLDELIDPQLLNNPPELSSYGVDLRQQMLRVPEDDLESQMDMLRQFKQAQQLRIAAADIVGVLPVTRVSDHLTALAEAILTEVINLAWQQLATRFGVPKSTVEQQDKGFAVLGYGKMGGIELGYASDLDLVFIHNSGSQDTTTGPREVSASVFYVKLAQRIMHIFNTRMSSGVLYELDMRLRPSGNSGVLVVHVDTFAQYQQQDAWTWEHQALIRARVVYGNPSLHQQLNATRQSVLCCLRDKQTLINDVVTMREKMRKHLDKSSDSELDIKQGKGALVDIEFLAQYLVLQNSYQFPEVGMFCDNIRIFKQLSKACIINKQQQEVLTQAYCQLRERGQKATLQNEQSVVPVAEFAQYRQQVIEIWQMFLG